MNLKRLMIMAAALCLAVGAVSCKKDKDDDSATSKSFSGTLSVQGVLPFVLKGTTVTAAPAGLGKEKVDIGYYWTASPLYTKRDTTRRPGDPSSVTGAYECKIKDTLCTVTVSCTAYATGYYTKSASAYCTIVDPAFGGSLKNDGVSKDMPSITDARDGNVYYYRKIGDKDWFVRNLAYKESGYPFRKSEVMDAIFGRYYTWTAAQDACPAGWRVPSEEDWKSLAVAAGYKGNAVAPVYKGVAGNLMVNASFNSERMWEFWPDVKITNATGFCSIPTGYGILGTGTTFYAGSEDAVYWTSSSYKEEGSADELAINRMINVNKPDFISNTVSKDSFLASVRCVRDSE